LKQDWNENVPPPHMPALPERYPDLSSPFNSPSKGGQFANLL